MHSTPHEPVYPCTLKTDAMVCRCFDLSNVHVSEFPDGWPHWQLGGEIGIPSFDSLDGVFNRNSISLHDTPNCRIVSRKRSFSDNIFPSKGQGNNAHDFI